MSTDASQTHIGAKLFQVNTDRQHQTIGFISQILKDPERRYHTTERKLLAINYILCYKTHIQTDHKALTFLNSCQLLNDRSMRWAINLQEFDINI